MKKYKKIIKLFIIGCIIAILFIFSFFKYVDNYKNKITYNKSYAEIYNQKNAINIINYQNSISKIKKFHKILTNKKYNILVCVNIIGLDKSPINNYIPKLLKNNSIAIQQLQKNNIKQKTLSILFLIHNIKKTYLQLKMNLIKYNNLKKNQCIFYIENIYISKNLKRYNQNTTLKNNVNTNSTYYNKITTTTLLKKYILF